MSGTEVGWTIALYSLAFGALFAVIAVAVIEGPGTRACSTQPVSR